MLPFGIKEIDEALPGGGLALGAVHEFSEEGPRGGYAACALLFAAGILARLPGPVLWCLHSRDLFAPALARVGLHPDRIIFCETWKDAEILPAMEEGLRMRGLAGVVGELNRISLTPSRRLQLAAETSGVPALIIRRSAEHLSESNAAMTRWRISPAPSAETSPSAWAVRSGVSNYCDAGAHRRIPGLWRHAMRRVVALFLPTFPTDQIRRRNGGAPARELPMVTAIQEGNRRVLASVDDAARKLKLACGMTVAHAQTLVPDLIVEDAKPEEDEAALCAACAVVHTLFAARDALPARYNLHRRCRLLASVQGRGRASERHASAARVRAAFRTSGDCRYAGLRLGGVALWQGRHRPARPRRPKRWVACRSRRCGLPERDIIGLARRRDRTHRAARGAAARLAAPAIFGRRAAAPRSGAWRGG